MIIDVLKQFPSISIRKYSFHWQRDSKCVVRWDNAPHHQEVATFPHHKHSAKVEQISDSEPMTLKKNTYIHLLKTQERLRGKHKGSKLYN